MNIFINHKNGERLGDYNDRDIKVPHVGEKISMCWSHSVFDKARDKFRVVDVDHCVDDNEVVVTVENA